MPRSENLGSPCQRLMGRSARTPLPVHPQNLQPETIPPQLVREELARERKKQKLYYDRTARDCSPMNAGERVRVKDPQENLWRKGTVITVLTQPRSYIVRDELTGKTSRRNRRLLNTAEEPPIERGEDDFETPPTSPGQVESPIVERREAPVLRRSSRIPKPNPRYNEAS